MLLEAAIAELPRGGEISLGSHKNPTTMTLFQDDHEFIGKFLRKDSFTHGNSHRFALKSSTSMHLSAGSLSHQCNEIETLANADEDYKPPISLAPIRIPSSFSNSPSSSTGQSPVTFTNKRALKAVLLNAKMSDNSGNSSPIIRSPLANVSSPRERKSLLSLCHGHSPSPSSTTLASENSFDGEDSTPRLSGSLFGRSPMLYSPCPPSPYYFSPLSCTSSHNLNATSPRSSIQSDTSNSSFEQTSLEAYMHGNINNLTSTTPKPHDLQDAFDNALYSITPLSEAGNSLRTIGGNNSSDSLSFTSPEMEVLDEGSALALNNANRGARGSMASFISRGRPIMQRSFSAPRATMADDLHQRPVLRKHYSAQFLAESDQTKLRMERAATCKALDELFPLKRPNRFKQAANAANNQHKCEGASETSTPLDMEERKMVAKGSVMSSLERPAQEVEMEGRGENGFAYSPVASAFVFSPRRGSPNSYFPRSASSSSSAAKAPPQRGSNLGNGTMQAPVEEGSQKGSFSSDNGDGVGGLSEGTPLSTRASWGSPKISSALLRFAEAQERLYNSAPATPQHLPSSSPTCLPVCSFLGRTFLCRSKFTMASETQVHSS